MIIYTVKEVAEMMKVKPITVYKWIDRGELKASKVGKTVRVTKESIEEMIKSNETELIK